MIIYLLIFNSGFFLPLFGLGSIFENNPERPIINDDSENQVVNSDNEINPDDYKLNVNKQDDQLTKNDDFNFGGYPNESYQKDDDEFIEDEGFASDDDHFIEDEEKQ